MLFSFQDFQKVKTGQFGEPDVANQACQRRCCIYFFEKSETRVKDFT